MKHSSCFTEYIYGIIELSSNYMHGYTRSIPLNILKFLFKVQNMKH